ncbi:hypothetical protein GCM10012289_28330 [Nonomuraea cavernae]|uniref:Uncharacterized protein n=1 Tax=Nonomuraea cavernae TaxID=2045107 RepID=A0A917YX92_9ACTN|nr:hypothetical protein GCM10012289_28330 [Nonomuraea cavernae]
MNPSPAAGGVGRRFIWEGRSLLPTGQTWCPDVKWERAESRSSGSEGDGGEWADGRAAGSREVPR